MNLWLHPVPLMAVAYAAAHFAKIGLLNSTLARRTVFRIFQGGMAAAFVGLTTAFARSSTNTRPPLGWSDFLLFGVVILGIAEASFLVDYAIRYSNGFDSTRIYQVSPLRLVLEMFVLQPICWVVLAMIAFAMNPGV